MIRETTVRTLGDAAGATIPKDMLDRFRLAPGDPVHLVETREGILITPRDPQLSEAMPIYEEGAKTYGSAMRELSK